MKQESAVKYKRISLAPAFAKLATTPDSDKETDDTASRTTSIADDSVFITALYDDANRLAEIRMHKIRVPRVMMQILSLVVPHYPYLTKLVLKGCHVNAYTVYEISKFLSLTTITDINLDGSAIPQGNYALLLESQSKLASLSLCRCNINDEVCKQLSSKLHNTEPAEATLSSLNLSSNHITDAGAKHLGEALRNNRQLRYLNLADNRIGDDGANHIFHALTDFPLTYDETMAKRQRHMTYLRSKQALYLKYLTQCDSKSLDDFSMISKKSAKKMTPMKSKSKKDRMKSSETDEDYLSIRAEMLANELIGPFIDPFIPIFTKFVDGYCHCIGNMVLCHLNLCYNRLTYISLKKLQAVLFYQSVNKKPNQTGLMRVLLEGNALPLACSEMERISEMLHRNVVNFSAKYVANKLKARARISRISVIPERIVK